MRIPDDAEEFEHGGYRFIRWTERDSDLREPWIEHDGHGDVVEIVNYPGERVLKRPGERVLHRNGRTVWLYDWQDAARKARKDWGATDIQAAVQADFDRMRGWLNDDWWWVGVCVQQLDKDGCPTGEVESLWGIESDSPDYHKEVSEELADQLLGPLEDIEREREIALLEAD